MLSGEMLTLCTRSKQGHQNNKYYQKDIWLLSIIDSLFIHQFYFILVCLKLSNILHLPQVKLPSLSKNFVFV